MSRLDELRSRLDDIDNSILDELGRRREAVLEILRVKKDGADFLRDRAREEQLLSDRIEYAKDRGLDGYFVTRVFREVLEDSVRLQQARLVRDQNPRTDDGRPLVVGFQGSEGAYSHLAALQHFRGREDQIVLRSFLTFREMLESVIQGQLDFAMQPIENTTAGSINEAYDLLNRLPVGVVGEEILKVDHCLVALEKVPLGQIRRVFSHPVALTQCSDFLTTLVNCHVESYADTAMAVQKVRDEQDLSQAAIASEEAARRHGLEVLKRGIANQRENFTRFMVVGREPMRCDERIPCKTSLILATRHEEGALARCLQVLAAHHLNMTKLESRPRPNVPWEYLFYIDFEGNVANQQVQSALQELTREVSYLKVLGSYPARTTDASRPTKARAGKRRGKKRSEQAEEEAARRRRLAEPLEVAAKRGYRLASRAHHPDDTVVRVGDLRIGDSEFTVIAGPCSVESWDQVHACAGAVREHGGHVLRGGVFKPRTSTYSFQGLGYEGLDLLVRAGREFDLPVITEVMHPSDVRRLAEVADMLQVGARNMQNFSLLKEIGTVDRPVLLKRGLMASIDELLAASEYLLAAGNHQVILCERGIRTFETATRNTLDLSAVPVLRERTHLPVLVDPSHATGNWRYVIPMAEAAQAAGAHGVMVEIHPEPEKALSDGPQALTPERFGELMRCLGRRAG